MSVRFLVVLLAVASACAAGGRPAASPAPAVPSAPSAAPPQAAGSPEVHHEVRVTLSPDRHLLAAEDAITLSPELRARLGGTITFSLHAGLAPERAGPGAPLERVASGPASDAGVPLEHYAVRLGDGERGFAIRYRGEVFHPIQRGEEYARGMSETPGIVSGDGALLSSATCWLPEVASGLLTFTLEARVPAGWEVVSQGTRTRHERGASETLVRWESGEPQQEVFLVAGPFFERSRQAGRVLVQTFLRADDAALAERYLGTAERYLPMYERLLGPYPYSKFALVENFWETGYGLPSFTLLGSQVIRFPFILHSSYPHEILHDWWGNGVFVDAKGGNWSEGLTAYLADHLVKEQRGEGAEYRRTSLQRYADYVATSRDFAVSAFRSRHSSLTQAVGYDKVLMVFHMLRQRLGDERFVAGLRRFYEAERFRAASFEDLARAMSAAAGEDLGPWLAQWIDRPGAPAIRLEGVEARGKVLEVRLAQAQEGAPYAVDVPVYVTVEGEPQVLRRSVRLEKARQRFTLELPAAPLRVDVDPEYDVFRRLDPAELPPALSGAFGASEALFVLPSAAAPELRAAYAALAEAWKADGTKVVTDAELPRLPAGKAVWVLGWENRHREAVAEGARAYGADLSAKGLRAGTTTLAREARSVVVVVRSPADAKQVVAFVGADDRRALPGLGRKLPHYGKYGLLGFEGDAPANVAKEIWPVPSSPMTAAVGPGPLVPRAAVAARRALAELPGGAEPR